MPTSSLHAVVLAAGAGRRMGFPKALLEVRGRWMLPRLVEALRTGGADRVHVVVRSGMHEALRERGGCGAAEVHEHPDADRGRTGTLLRGLRAVPDDAAVLVHPCDVPLLSAAAVSALVAAWRRHDEHGIMVARPVTPGGRGGHPLLLGRERVADLRRFAPDQPLRDLVHQNSAREIRVPWRGDPGPFLDVDTPEQLALLESLLDPPRTDA